VMNRSEHAPRFALSIDGIRAGTELPPRSIATYLT
jgi:hypothetical protein